MSWLSETAPGRFAWFHLPPVLFGALILFLSSIPNLHGPEIESIGVDKIAHFTEYAVFGWLLSRSVLRWGAGPWRAKLLITLMILVLFACGDEVLQSFIPGRDSSLFDVAADIIGAASALFLVYRSRGRNHS